MPTIPDCPGFPKEQPSKFSLGVSGGGLPLARTPTTALLALQARLQSRKIKLKGMHENATVIDAHKEDRKCTESCVAFKVVHLSFHLSITSKNSSPER